MDMDFANACPLVRPALPRIRFLFVGSRLCSTLPSDGPSRFRPCALLVLHLHQVAQGTFTPKLSDMSDTQPDAARLRAGRGALVQTARSDRLRWHAEEPRSAMAKLKTIEELFKGRHFDRDVVILCVRWYLRFKLSLRDLVEMMVERGLSMAHRRSCAGCSATRRSLRNAGADLPEQSAGHGGSTRHTSRSEANGATCIVPSIGPAGRSTSG